MLVMHLGHLQASTSMQIPHGELPRANGRFLARWRVRRSRSIPSLSTITLVVGTYVQFWRGRQLGSSKRSRETTKKTTTMRFRLPFLVTLDGCKDLRTAEAETATFWL